jgi:hypothetical protein
MAGETLGRVEAKPSSVKIFNCPSCGAGIVLRAVGQSVSAVCSACNSLIDTKDENYKIIKAAMTQTRRKPLIPLGQRGKLKGALWEVIGFMERSDAGYAWDEYLLFNPARGFRWLTEANGHWNYVVMTKEKPTRFSDAASNSSVQAQYLGRTYGLFNSGSAKVTYVEGEFYWQVKVGDTAKVQDYVFAPEILSCETTPEEVTWSLGEYIEASEVKKSFDIKGPMPAQSGVAPNQFSKLGGRASEITKHWAWLVALLCVLQFINVLVSDNTFVYQSTFAFSSVDADSFRSSTPFVFTGNPSNVKFTVAAPLQNNWLEVEIDLVNDENGKVYELQGGIEYYSGYDSDGSWNEGSRVLTKSLSAIPAGKYHFNLDVSGPGVPQPLNNKNNFGYEEIVTPVNAIFTEETWPNGKKKSSIPSVGGKYEGIAKYYREDGTLEKEVGYKNNQLHGVSRHYDQQGNLEQAFIFKENIRLSEIVVKDSLASALPVTVVVQWDVTNWSNFFLALLLLTLYPIFVWWRSRSFEMERWSQSDYSPYSAHHGE